MKVFDLHARARGGGHAFACTRIQTRINNRAFFEMLPMHDSGHTVDHAKHLGFSCRQPCVGIRSARMQTTMPGFFSATSLAHALSANRFNSAATHCGGTTNTPPGWVDRTQITLLWQN